MLKARDYYYKFIEPQESLEQAMSKLQKNYTKTEKELLKTKYRNVGHEEAAVNEAMEKLQGHGLEYSNDYSIDLFIKNSIQGDEQLVKFFKDTFIVKTQNYFLNASALNTSNLYKGYIVKINQGLDYFLKQVSYAAIFPIIFITSSLDNNSSKKVYEEKMIQMVNSEKKVYKALMGEVELDIEEINNYFDSSILEKFQKEENFLVVRLTKALLHFNSMAFVSLHEIGHHYLKHTQSNLVRNFLNQQECNRLLNKNSLNESHSMEFQADIFATNFLLHLKLKEAKYLNNSMTILSPFFVLFSLGYLNDNILRSSESHPSIIERLEFIGDYLLEYDKEVFNEKGVQIGLQALKYFTLILFTDKEQMVAIEAFWEKLLMLEN